MTTLIAPPLSKTADQEPPLLLERLHLLAALAILFVFFATYQTLVQTVITDDSVRLAIEADEYDMTWVTVAYGVGVLYGVFAGLSLSFRIGKRYTLVLAMYWAYVPIGLAAALLVWKYIRPDRPAQAIHIPIDWLVITVFAAWIVAIVFVFAFGLVPQMGWPVLEPVRRHGRTLRRPPGGAGRLARVRPEPRRTSEANPSPAGLRAIPGNARAYASAFGCRTDNRRNVLHRVARVSANHRGLVDRADLFDDGNGHLPYDPIPPSVAAARLADRGNNRFGGLRLVTFVNRQFHPKGTRASDAGLLGGFHRPDPPRIPYRRDRGH